MPQDFDLKLNGESVRVESANLTLTFDTANDGFTAQIVCDSKTQQKLYKAIKPFHAPSAQIYLDGMLLLTGKMTKTTSHKTTTGISYDLEGWSNTFNFVDSDLSPPYEYSGTIDKILAKAAEQTGSRVVYTGTDPGGVFERVTAQEGQTGFQFCDPLAQQRQHVISSTADGRILLQKADISQNPVGMIDENSLLQTEFSASFDYRKRFRTYKLISKRWDGNHEAISTDANIKDARHKLIKANDQVPGGIKQNADYYLKLALIEALKQTIPVVGWYAPNKTLWKPGTLLTLKSEANFCPDGFIYFIRQVDFHFDAKGKTADLSLIPKEIYSDEPITEPWFTSDVKEIYLQYQNARLG